MATNDNLRPIVADILNVPDDKGEWLITDVLNIPGTDTPRLAMVSTTKDSTLDEFRGVMVEIPNRFVYGSSRGQVPTFVADEIPVVDGQLVLEEYTAPIDKVNFQPMFDGVVIRTLLVDGETVLATHKKFNPDRSHWEKSMNFSQMFTALGLPLEELYSEDASFSPVVHSFLLNDPALRVASKYPGGPMTVYLGPRTDWDEHTSPYDPEMVDFDIREPDEMFTVVMPRLTTPYIYVPEFSLTVKKANQHLEWSWESPRTDADLMDPRHLPGGGLMVYLPNGELIKIVSSSWDWRDKARLNTSNLALAVWRAKDSIKDGSYEETFPTLQHQSMKNLMAQAGHIVSWPTVDSIPTTDAQKTTNLLNSYVLAVPFHRQAEILELRRSMNHEMARLVGFILTFLPDQTPKARKERGKETLDWKQKIKVRLENYDDRVVDRIISILGFVMASTKDVKQSDLDVQRRAQTRLALDREGGGSLYRMVKAMHKYYDSQI